MENYIKLKYGYLVVFARKQITLAEFNGKIGRKVLLDRIIEYSRAVTPQIWQAGTRRPDYSVH